MKHLAPTDAQLTLFYQPRVLNCTSTASARNAFGEAAQELVYQLLGVERIPIHGGYAVCFDGKKNGMYYEVKSTRLSGGKVVAYDWRMAKEAESGVPLTYLLVCHSLRGTRADILKAMADGPVTFVSVPAEVVHRYALQCKLMHIKRNGRENARNGYVRGGYNKGYRNLSVKALTEGCEWSEETVENTLGAGVVNLRTYLGEKG